MSFLRHTPCLVSHCRSRLSRFPIAVGRDVHSNQHSQPGAGPRSSGFLLSRPSMFIRVRSAERLFVRCVPALVSSEIEQTVRWLSVSKLTLRPKSVLEGTSLARERGDQEGAAEEVVSDYPSEAALERSARKNLSKSSMACLEAATWESMARERHRCGLVQS